jgi:hypothetical protein
MDSVLDELRKLNLGLDNIDSHMGRIDDTDAKMSEMVELKGKLEKLEVKLEERHITATLMLQAVSNPNETGFLPPGKSGRRRKQEPA